MATDISDIRSLVRCKVTAAAMTALGLVVSKRSARSVHLGTPG